MDLNRVITELRMEWAPNRQYKRDECGVLQTYISNWLLKLELGAVGGLNFCRLVRPGLAYFSAERTTTQPRWVSSVIFHRAFGHTRLR